MSTRKHRTCFGIVLLGGAVVLALLVLLCLTLTQATRPAMAKPTSPPTPTAEQDEENKPEAPATPEGSGVVILPAVVTSTPEPTSPPPTERPTATPTATPHPTSTPTRTPRPTSTPTATPSPTPTTPPSPTPTAASTTSGLATTALLGVALPLFGGGVAVIGLALLSVSRAIRHLERTYRRQKALELEQLQAQTLSRRRDKLRNLFARPKGWKEVVQQLLVDAQVLNPAEAASALHDRVRVSAAPPHFVVGTATGHYLFTTALDQAHGEWDRVIRGGEVVSLDAALSPTARVEAQALWEHFARDGGLQASALPRDSAWHLAVREVPDWRPRRNWPRRLLSKVGL